MTAAQWDTIERLEREEGEHALITPTTAWLSDTRIDVHFGAARTTFRVRGDGRFTSLTAGMSPSAATMVHRSLEAYRELPEHAPRLPRTL